MKKSFSAESLERVHTFQRSGKWCYRFETAKVDGKRCRQQKGGYASEKEALIAGVAAYEAYENGGAVAQASSMSFADFLDLWYERTKLNARNNTLELREKNIRLHIKPALGSYRLTTLTPALIDDFVKDKRAAGYAYETVERMLSNISVALDYAIWPMQLLSDNPARLIRVPGKEFAPLSNRRPRRRIEDDELAKIFEMYPFGNTFHMPLALGLYFGIRIGETIALSWDGCDMGALVLAVRWQIQRLAMRGHIGMYYLCEPKTAGSNRTLAFDTQVILPLLRRWKQQQHENELYYGGDYFYNYIVPAKDYQGRPIKRVVSLEKAYPAPGPRLDLICTQLNGKYIKPCTLSYQCKRIRRAGVHDFNFHCLRHTNLTMLGESQAAPNDIMARAGHTDYKTTMTYIDDRPDMQRQPVKIIAGKVKDII